MDKLEKGTVFILSNNCYTKGLYFVGVTDNLNDTVSKMDNDESVPYPFTVEYYTETIDNAFEKFKKFPKKLVRREVSESELWVETDLSRIIKSIKYHIQDVK